MKPGFLLEAARKNAKSILQTGLVICAVSVLVLLLNGRYVYNWVAGPFTITSALAESPGTREFGRIHGALIPTGIVEQRTMTIRVMRRALETSSTSVSANYYLCPLDGRFVVVKTAPDFSGLTASGRMVPLPENIRSFPNLAQVKLVDDRTLRSEDLYPTMLDASFSYRADANLFVIVAAFVLVLGLLGVLYAMPKVFNPQKHPMLRLVGRTGVQSALRRIEQEFIALGNGCHFGPLLISSAWVYDAGSDALVFPLKDVIGVTKKAVNKSGKPPSYSVEFWLRSDLGSHSVKAGDKECDAIIDAIRARIPWAVIEPGSPFESNWRRDRQGCISEMERRKKQQETAALATK